MPASVTLYLASASPRRQQLLQQLGLQPQLLLPDPDEDAEALEAVHGRESPQRYVQRVTALKIDAAVARAARRGIRGGAILCADTTVALGSTILGKPADADEAAAMLHRLSGGRHRVLTAVALARGKRRWSALQISHVDVAPLSTAAIRAYVASGEPLGKAGAYAVQGRAAAFISRIAGSHSGIMGLPLFETAALLREAGVMR